MENDNSDATQIMDRVVENEITTTETPTKPKPKRATRQHVIEHLAKARSARTEAYSKQKQALVKLKQLEDRGVDIEKLLEQKEPVVELPLQSEESESESESEEEVVIKKKPKKKPKKKVVYYSESESESDRRKIYRTKILLTKIQYLGLIERVALYQASWG